MNITHHHNSPISVNIDFQANCRADTTIFRCRTGRRQWRSYVLEQFLHWLVSLPIVSLRCHLISYNHSYRYDCKKNLETSWEHLGFSTLWREHMKRGQIQVKPRESESRNLCCYSLLSAPSNFSSHSLCPRWKWWRWSRRGTGFSSQWVH